MKKFCLALLAVAAALAIAPAALAGTLCPSAAGFIYSDVSAAERVNEFETGGVRV
jgi:hypothetical protein